MPLLPASAQGTIAGAPEVVYKALADYDSWQEWVPSLASARLLTREDRLAIVELNPGGKEAESLMLECIETPGKSVLARVIEGMAPIRELEWSVEPADPGFSRVRLTVKRGIGLRLLHPSAWRVLNPAECLEALRRWISASNPGPEAVADGENLFELWETEAGLMCWVKGRKYKLTPVEEGKA
jgi:hypothetical protein